MSADGHILTFSERPEVGVELLAAARKLAGSSGARVVSLLLGRERAALADEEIARGADTVILAGRDASAPTDPGGLLTALAAAVQDVQPAVLLVGSTRLGAEVTARLGQRLGVATASECLELGLDDAGNLIVERFVYGGRFVARRVIRSTPRIAAVQLKRFEPLPADPERRGDSRQLSVELPTPSVTVVERKEPQRSQVDIGKAEVVVSAGRGLRSKDDLALLESLTDALGGGVVAGSRPLVEMQWIPRDRQVGLSGEKVKPRLYLACGVSGQIEHVAGMRPSRVVVAINTNPDAPIHSEADYSITQDMYEVVPALIAALASARSRTTGAAPVSAEETSGPGAQALEPA